LYRGFVHATDAGDPAGIFPPEAMTVMEYRLEAIVYPLNVNVPDPSAAEETRDEFAVKFPDETGKVSVYVHAEEAVNPNVITVLDWEIFNPNTVVPVIIDVIFVPAVTPVPVIY
jgi:hypothetical protein